MRFEPDVEVLLDAIAMRRMPRRVPNYEPYYNRKTVSTVLGKPVPPDPPKTKDECRRFLRLIVEYCLAIRSDIIPIELEGPFLPTRRESERTEYERENYLTQRDIPTILHRRDYERYGWPEERGTNLSPRDRMMLETVVDLLPDGMGVMASHNGIFEVMNYLLGYENFCYVLADDPELIDVLAERLGRMNLKTFYEAAQYDFVRILHMGDDIAFRGGTLVAPHLLRKWLFPWLKRYADVAHSARKVFTFHSDGNFKEVAEDMVRAGVDGKQAFEDVSYKVTDFKKDFGDRISALGGIDVDALARLGGRELRLYVRRVLEICVPGGGYAVGSGNCFTTFIPVENYWAMLDEAEAFLR